MEASAEAIPAPLGAAREICIFGDRFTTGAWNSLTVI